MGETYIIGGTPRSGKSTLAKILFDKHHINFMRTDLLREGLMLGVPEFGILKDEEKQSDEDKSIILWPYFKGILEARKYLDDDLVIEGTNFEPKFLAEFRDREDLKILFLGFTEVDVDEKSKQIRASEENDIDEWTSEMSDDELRGLVEYLKQKSIYFKNECEKYNMKYIDTSKNFELAINEAMESLIKKEM